MGLVAVVALLFGVLVYPTVRGGGAEPKRASSPRPRPPAGYPASAPQNSPLPVPLPSGQSHDDRQPQLSGGPSGPVELPPRYDKPPAAPLSDADLKAATDRAMAFLEVFANGRWNETAEEQIRKISQFVPQAQLDAVLAAYQKVRPNVERHELVTYRVTAARWLFLGEGQASLAVEGDRAVRGDAGVASARRGFVLTLVSGGGWQVTDVRDPGEGDAGVR